MSDALTTPHEDAQLALEPEVIIVPDDTESVMCDGGHGSLGHPAVYYRFDGQSRVICGYCDREFVKDSAATS